VWYERRCPELWCDANAEFAPDRDAANAMKRVITLLLQYSLNIESNESSAVRAVIIAHLD